MLWIFWISARKAAEGWVPSHLASLAEGTLCHVNLVHLRMQQTGLPIVVAAQILGRIHDFGDEPVIATGSSPRGA